MEKVKDLPGAQLHTPLQLRRSSAIELRLIESKKPVKRDRCFFNQHRIFTTNQLATPIAAIACFTRK